MMVEDRLVERQGDQWSVRTALDDVAMPPTIQSLLAARLDRLDDQERAIVQRASIAGKVFWWGAVVELSPQEARAEVGARLQTLVRKQLIEPEQAGFDGEDAFRFAHILIRDAAYAAIPKAVRAELHERYAGWLERRAGDRLPELEEVVGYHLEQSVRYRKELGTAGAHERELALRAGSLLGAAGRRAFRREDMPAALKLLDRAVALLTDSDPARLELMRELSFALWSVGELARAETLLNGLVEAAAATGDRRIEWYALLERAGRGTELGTDPDELLQTARQAIEVFEELGDDLGLARAWRRVATAQQMSGRFGPGADAGERARRHAYLADDAQEESRIVDRLCTSLLFGPAPADDAAARCRELLERAGNSPLLEANVRSSLAALVGIAGALDEARRQYRRAYELYEELGLRLPLAGLSQLVGSLELAAGDAEAAERELRRGYEILEPVGATATQAALLAQTLYVQGRYRESEAALGAATGRGIQCRIVAGGVQAKLAAQRGELDTALELAQGALVVANETDSPTLQADALLDLGEVEHLAGDLAAARRAYAAAQRLFGAKGHVLGARQVEARLRALTA